MVKFSTRHNARASRLCRAFFIALPLCAISSLPVRAADMEVNIENFTSTPKELTVKAGTTIVFRNQDDIPHSVVGAKGEFHSKALDTDGVFEFTFAKAGTYGYSLACIRKCKARSWSSRDRDHIEACDHLVATIRG